LIERQRVSNPLGTQAKSLCSEFNAGILDFAIRQKPDKRFIVKINDLDAIAPWIQKVTAKRGFQFQFIFLGEFLSDFLELRFIANHDPEMPKISRLHVVHLKNSQKLVFTQFEEGVPLAAAHLFEIENILIKRHRFVDVIHFNCHMVTAINPHAHISA
jgi:hypothetical protein